MKSALKGLFFAGILKLDKFGVFEKSPSGPGKGRHEPVHSVEEAFF